MIKKILIIVITLMLNSTLISIAKEQNYKIIKLVNNQVITNYDLETRLRLFSFTNNVTLNAENIDIYAREMLKVMIDEKLQFDHLKKYKVNISNDEIESYIIQAYLKPGQSIEDFELSFIKNELDFAILKESIAIQLGWNELSGRLFYRTAEVTDIDLSNAMEKNASLTENQVKNLIIQEQIELRAKKLLRDIRAEANIENR